MREISPPFSHQLGELKARLHTLEQDVALYDDPANFDAAMGRLKAFSQLIVGPVLSHTRRFKSRKAVANPSLRALCSAIRCFDQNSEDVFSVS